MRAAVLGAGFLCLIAGCGGSGGPSDTASAVPLPRVDADAGGRCPVAYGIKAGTFQGKQVYVVNTAPGPDLSTSEGRPGALPKFDDFPAKECFSSAVEARVNGYLSLDPQSG